MKRGDRVVDEDGKVWRVTEMHELTKTEESELGDYAPLVTSTLTLTIARTAPD